MATIWGTNLADTTASSVSPWSSFLGGTEVHLAGDTCFDSSCDLVASLIYVSPTQINFLVPDNGSTSCQNCTPTAYRIVFIRDGQRIDNRSYILGGPGRLIIDPFDIADYNVVFQVGYDCLFSYSLSDPASCGLSWSQGQHRAVLGAVTDAVSGQLISSQAPVHQGQLITLWMTALYGGVTLDNKTALLQQANPAPIGFGVAQSGKDIPATIGSGFNGPFGTFMSPAPIWAGESPQFVGLDQVNVAFPTCANAPATTEKRYDAFLTYTSINTSTTVRIYVPFVVRHGDPDCQWTVNTITTLTSSLNPAVFGQLVTFAAIVAPVTATGTVTFLDGTAVLGSGTLGGGKATFSTSSLAVGSHSITASYGGDTNDKGSTSATLTETVSKLPAPTTTTTLTSSLNSSGTVTFTASVSPSTATGTVDFIDSDGASCTTGCILIGSATLSNGSAAITGTLRIGTHLVVALYNGNSYYGSSTSTALTWTGTSTTLTSSTNPSASGQPITFTVTVSPSTAIGSVEFNAGAPPIIGCPEVGALVNGQWSCTSPNGLAVGSHSITAIYSGNSSTDYSGSSGTLTQTVNTQTYTTTTLASSLNPSVLGQSVTFTATVAPFTQTGTVEFLDGGTEIGSASLSLSSTLQFSTKALSVGSHPITAIYTGAANRNGSTSALLTQTVNAH
jgi:uncharacterized protein (TIGR03437 family)